MAESEFNFKPSKHLESWTDLTWTVRGSNIEDYLKDFSLVDGDNVLVPFLSSLREKSPAVVLDFLSWTDAIRSLAGRFKIPHIKGAAIAYSDKRGPLSRLRDTRRGIRQLTGDLNTDLPWEKTKEFLGDDRAHLIMERGVAGLSYLSDDPRFYCRAINRLWSMLDPNDSMMILQTPNFERLEAYGVPVRTWIERIQDQIYFKYVPGYNAKTRMIVGSGYSVVGIILLKRDSSSPGTLSA